MCVGSFSAKLDPSIPHLAWVARISTSTLAVAVRHGDRVEVRSNFAVEGAWCGAFSEGDFHSATHFFGSGIRLDEDGVWLVPASTLVDRLLLVFTEDQLIVSNSLSLLLAESGQDLDENHDYRRESFASLRGIRDYPREFLLADSSVRCEQLFYTPWLVTKEGIAAVDRPRAAHDFRHYDEYLRDLRAELRRVVDNLRSPDRLRPFDLYSTTSAGYDSSAATALASEHGLIATYTSRFSNTSLPTWVRREAAIDDGSPIADALGVKVRLLTPPALVGESELAFLSATVAEAETVFHSLALDLARSPTPSAVFTGYHGDKVWARDEKPRYDSPELLRGDTSGLNLTEVRLDAAFLNIPVPFFFAREVASIRTISQAQEMMPWSVGGDYDRPIPRRILELAGVARSAFGTRKRAVIQAQMLPHNSRLRASFGRYLRAKYGFGIGTARAISGLKRAQFLCLRIAEELFALFGARLSPDYSDHRVIGIDLRADLFRWAVRERTRLFRRMSVDERRDV
jgi:hypothetical protein